MTQPGPVERIPTKVVPYVVTGYAEDEAEPTEPEQAAESPAEERKRRGRSPWPGIMALTLAVLTAVMHGFAVAVASGNDFESATLLGYGAIALSGASVLGGIVALILGSGRWWGVGAIVLGLLANPLLLLVVLEYASTLVAR